MMRSAPFRISCATRWARVLVLPVPAPAAISKAAGDRVLPSMPCSTALRCAGFKSPPTSPVPGRHVCRVRWSIGAGTKEPVIVASVDVMSLHYPHQMHRVGAAGKAPVSVVDVVADPLGAGEPLRAQSDRACAMLRLRNAMRHRPGLFAIG